jgi:hypothetical protein
MGGQHRPRRGASSGGSGWSFSSGSTSSVGTGEEPFAPGHNRQNVLSLDLLRLLNSGLAEPGATQPASMLELTLERRVHARVSLAAILGMNTDWQTQQPLFEVGGQARVLLLGHYNHNLHVGLQATQFMGHDLEPTGSPILVPQGSGTTGSLLVGYKVTVADQFSVEAQLGKRAWLKSSSDPVTDAGFMTNLKLGYAF